MGWFKTKKQVAQGNGHFGEFPYHIVYEMRPVPPDFDTALRTAYDSLALPPVAPVGRATAIRGTMPGWLPGRQLWQPMMKQQVTGLPITAGGTYAQPLYDPRAQNDGYVWQANSAGVLPGRNIPL